MKIDPNSPAFPNPELGKSHFNDPGAYPGLPIRLHLAAMAMQGILAGKAGNVDMWDDENAEMTARQAIERADALLAEYNKEAKP